MEIKELKRSLSQTFDELINKYDILEEIEYVNKEYCHMITKEIKLEYTEISFYNQNTRELEIKIIIIDDTIKTFYDLINQIGIIEEKNHYKINKNILKTNDKIKKIQEKLTEIVFIEKKFFGFYKFLIQDSSVDFISQTEYKIITDFLLKTFT